MDTKKLSNEELFRAKAFALEQYIGIINTLDLLNAEIKLRESAPTPDASKEQ